MTSKDIGSRLPIHDLGTLRGLTRWISKHESGVSEWFKNVRSAYYQEGRTDVKPNHKVAVLLIKSAGKDEPSRIGVLDVGGFTFEDVKNWSVWNKPDASYRGGPKQEETQGNGGKSYMYRLFKGPAFILGVKGNKLNQAGFIGENNSLERGLPRFYPSSNREIWQSGSLTHPNVNEKDVPIKDWSEELINQLSRFNTGISRLPKDVQDALHTRKAFTLVEGEDPIDWDWEGSNVKQFIKKLIRNPQSSRAIQQVKFYVIHDDKLLFSGEPLELEKIESYPGLEGPFEYPIPEILLAPNGNQVNTTKSSSGKHPLGKTTLFTSKDSMEASYKTLQPRWMVTYRTRYEDVGQKSIPEIVPATPGSHFIYAQIDLDALTPDSVDSGRKRPNDTSLVLAVDRFLAEKIRELARQINDLQKQEISESTLDEIEKENNLLNKLKNEFLPAEGGQDFGDISGDNEGKKKKTRDPTTYGTKPNEIRVSTFSIKIAKGVQINLTSILHPSVRDQNGNPVDTDLEWKSDDRSVIKLDKKGNCDAISKGSCKIYISVIGTDIITPPIAADVVVIKDVLLSPREMKIGVGHSKQIIAQVTTDEDERFSDILLDWSHDAADQGIVKISPRGYVFGNKVGKTSVTSGTKNDGDLWATNPVSVEIIPSDDKGGTGSGFPTLKITDREIDPYTGKIRPGDPEAPALWQEFWDEKNNIWWLNTQSKDAQFAYSELQRGNKGLWKMFHAKLLVEMVIQAHLDFEYTKRGEEEREARWSDHKSFYDRKYVELTKAMWGKYLIKYVNGELEID